MQGKFSSHAAKLTAAAKKEDSKKNDLVYQKMKLEKALS